MGVFAGFISFSRQVDIRNLLSSRCRDGGLRLLAVGVVGHTMFVPLNDDFFGHAEVFAGLRIDLAVSTSL